MRVRRFCGSPQPPRRYSSPPYSPSYGEKSADWFEADCQAFGYRGVAAFGYVVGGHEDVGFRVVRRCAAAGGGVRDEAEARGAPFDAGELADDVDVLAVLQAELGQNGRVHEEHFAGQVHAAVAVLQSVDRGVELVVTAHRLQ